MPYFFMYLFFITVLVTIGMLLVRITRDPLFKRNFIPKSKRQTITGKVITKEKQAKASQHAYRSYNEVSGVNVDKYSTYYVTLKTDDMEFYFQLPYKDYMKIGENKYYQVTYYKELFYNAVEVEKPTVKEDDPFKDYFRGDK